MTTTTFIARLKQAVAELRAEARRLVQASPLWDQRDWVFQVVDSTPST